MRLFVVLLLACLVALSAPAGAQGRAQERADQLDRLFKALRAAPSEQAAGMLETRIRQLWVEEATPAAALLMARGDRDLHNDAGDEAVADFDAVLDLQPDYAEGYTHRAIARAANGDTTGAVRDVEAALQRDPRHFPALETLSHIAEQQGNWAGALAAWQKALDIDPLTEGGLDRLEKLQKKVDGEAT
jgi:tetratricopeptide (TPR) repeat protein